jgi:hypothetical protein
MIKDYTLSTILDRKSINLDITHRCTLECPKCLRRSVPKICMKYCSDDKGTREVEVHD